MQSMTRPLKQWLCINRHNPYPSKKDKETLCNLSNMSLTQVSNWFANARRRLKSTVKGEEFSWSSRVKLYNSHVEGNAELLSISSDDSIFDSDDNTGKLFQWVFQWGSCYSIFIFMCMFVDLCLSFLFWPLCCLFFNLRLLITSLFYFQTLLVKGTHRQKV